MEDELYGGFGVGENEGGFSAPANLAPVVRPGAGPLRGGAAAVGGAVRPMTSVAGAGYQSGGRPVTGAGAPVAAGRALMVPPFKPESVGGPAAQAAELEARVHAQLESSAAAAAKGDAMLALDRAKEAGRRERALAKFRESSGLGEGAGAAELTFAVQFNLAHTFFRNKMYAESLAAYKLIVKKRGPLARRLHVNVGNIHMAQGSFSEALKEYQKALDNLPPGGSCTRARVQTNIGLAHVRLGAYQEAITSFTNVMEVRPSFQAAFNLIVCFFAMGDTELMVKGLDSLLALPLPLQEEAEDKEEDEEEGKEVEGGGGGAGGGVGAAGGGGGGGGGSGGEGHISAAAAALSALAPRDALRDELQARQAAALNAIKLAARLIAPELGHGGDWAAGFDDVVRRLRLNHPHCASELQICKALQYLRRKEFSRAIEELKAFEKRDAALKAKAANNLAFLYLLENDVAQAAKFAALAVRNDRYNARALVNMGNALVEERGELEKAKELYLEAIGVEADCVEAIFNLGLVNRQLGALGEAIQAFEKLHTLVPAAPEVLHHLAVLHEATDNYDAAQKYAALLVSRCPTDSGALARLGQLYARMAAAASGTDGCSSLEAQAFHYTAEAYRVFPVNLEVISWLGVWYVKSEMYERAIEFFMRASELQPGEVKWRLMVASCHRRMGAVSEALELYQGIHELHPDNLECLRYLVALSRDLGKRTAVFEERLAKLERAAAAAAAAREQRGGGGEEEEDYQQGGEGGYAYEERAPPPLPPPRAPAPSPPRAPAPVTSPQPAAPSGFGSSNDRFAAPSNFAGSSSRVGAGGGGDRKDDEFNDADLGGLLQ